MELPNVFSSAGWTQEGLESCFQFEEMYSFRKQSAHHFENQSMFYGAHAVFAMAGDLPSRVSWVIAQFTQRGGVVEDSISPSTNLVVGATMYHIEIAFGQDTMAFDAAIMQAHFMQYDWITQSFKHGDLIPMNLWRLTIPRVLVDRALRPTRVKIALNGYLGICKSLQIRMESRNSKPTRDSKACPHGEFPRHCSQLPPWQKTTLWCFEGED
jgi:hypothetical protein